MVTLDECKEILNKEDIKFTQEEIKKIRDYLYMVATIQIEGEEEAV